jgi:hypothetical protein
MTIEDFITAHQLTNIELWPTKEGSKAEYSGRAISKTEGELRLVSVNKEKGGYSKEKPTFVYEAEAINVDQTTGEETVDRFFVLSNNAGKEAAITMNDFM